MSEYDDGYTDGYNQATIALDSLRAEVDQWKEEALQKYPTQEAYNAVCNARTNWQERAEQAEAQNIEQGKSLAQCRALLKTACEDNSTLKEKNKRIKDLEAQNKVLRGSLLTAIENLVGIRLITKDGVGATQGDIKAIEQEDDGSITIVVVAWPEGGK